MKTLLARFTRRTASTAAEGSARVTRMLPPDRPLPRLPEIKSCAEAAPPSSTFGNLISGRPPDEPALSSADSRVPPVAGTCAPRLARTSWFTGALLPICNVEVLVVVVQPRIFLDVHEANLYVSAFHTRFRRTIVLVAQDDHTHVPTYYGPAEIVRPLSMLPFEAIPWQRILYRVGKPASWRLPIPPEEPASDSSLPETGSYSSSIEELAQTSIRGADGDDIRDVDGDDIAADARAACTTRR